MICAYGHENILLLKIATDHGYKLVIQFVVFFWDVDEVGELEAQRFKDVSFELFASLTMLCW